MLADDDAPDDVKKASSVTHAIRKGERDDTFEGYPRVQKKRRKWVHCDEKKPKTRKTDGNGGCCQNKREKRRQKSQRQKFQKITVYGEPCELPKEDVIPRQCLTKREHITLLAEPRRRCPPECNNQETVVRRVKPISPRMKELAKPPRRRVLMTLRDGATRLPASLLDNLVNALEEETCLTPEQAATVSRSRKAKKKKTAGTKKEIQKATEWGYAEAVPKAKKPSPMNASPLDRESVICQYLMAERFVKSILKWKCPIPRDEFRDISQVVIKRLSNTLEYTPTEDEDRKSQQMRFLADILACWIAGIITEVADDHEQELQERCKKQEEKKRALDKEEDEDEDFDDDQYGDKYDEQRGTSDFDESQTVSPATSKAKSAASLKKEQADKEEEEELVIEYDEKPPEEVAVTQDATEAIEVTVEEVKGIVEQAEQGELGGPVGSKVGIGAEGAEMERAMEQPFDEQEAAKVGLAPEGTPTEVLASTQAKVEFEVAMDASEGSPHGTDPSAQTSIDGRIATTSGQTLTQDQQPAQEISVILAPPSRRSAIASVDLRPDEAQIVESAARISGIIDIEALSKDPSQAESALLAEGMSEVTPGATMSGAIPGATMSGAIPGATASGTIPGATGSGAIPGATASGAVPGATASGAIPGATTSRAIPGATASGAIPGATASGAIPGATASGAIPGATGSEAIPGATVSGATAEGTGVTPGGVFRDERAPGALDIGGARTGKEGGVSSMRPGGMKGIGAAAIGPSGETIPSADRVIVEELLKSDLPFLTFDKIVDTIHKMVEDAPMNTGENETVNNLHRAIYEKMKTVVAMDSPDLLSKEMRQKLHITCGKIATWLQTLLSESQLEFMEKYVPQVESQEVREWLQWLCYLCNAASDWNTWLRNVILEMSEMKGAQITRRQWHDWTKRVDKGALLWRLFHLEAKHRARKNTTMTTGRQVAPTGTIQKAPFQNSEQILRATDLHA